MVRIIMAEEQLCAYGVLRRPLLQPLGLSLGLSVAAVPPADARHEGGARPHQRPLLGIVLGWVQRHGPPLEKKLEKKGKCKRAIRVVE